MSIFGITDEQEIDDIVYINWLSLIWAGVVGLELYDPLTKKWLQAHTQARYALMQALLEAGQGLIDIKETENGENLLLSVDRTKIGTVGRDAIHNVLLKIQIYKSTGDFENAEKLYNHYSKVCNDSGSYTWEKWRDIVLAHKKPRAILVQVNTDLQGNYRIFSIVFNMNSRIILFFSDDSVTLKSYESTLNGYIESCVDRFRSNDETCNILENVWEAEKQYFPTLVGN